MTVSRRTLSAAIAIGLAAMATAPAAVAADGNRGRPGTGITSVTAITQIFTFGQEVAAVAVEYPAVVNPRTLDLGTFTVSDSIYNFRFSPLEDLATRADRTITRVYTNDEATIDPDGTSEPGRFVIIELDPADAGGNTVMRSTCSGFLCYEKINPDLPTEVVQNEDVYAQPGNGQGRGRVLAEAGPTSHPLSGETVNLLADEFHYETYLHAGMAVPYAYHLPADYDPAREYPLVVVLPGWGSGYNGVNEGVQVAVDISTTAWLQEEWTGSDEDVIVLSPQTQRVGTDAESAAMVALLDEFMGRFSVDGGRVYVQTFSWGSTLAWDAMADRPGIFAGVLIAAGFPVSAAQAALIAQDLTPVWITHGTNDPVLPVTFGQTSVQVLRDAYVAAGLDPAAAADLVRYTEFPPEAYAVPDYHAVVGPTYETQSILAWLLAQGD